MTAAIPIRLPDARTTVAGREVVLHYGNPDAEYAALASGALLVDRSERGRMRLSGAQAAEMLTGLVTNDVVALSPGDGCYAAALNAKGKILADIRILREGPTEFLVDSPVRAADVWFATVRKFVNPRLAPYRDVTGELVQLGVFGVSAVTITARATGLQTESLRVLAEYEHVAGAIAGEPVLVSRSPHLGSVAGFELFAPTAVREALWRALLHGGATAAGLEAFDVARIEAGRPEWGLDIDDSTIPQEANFDDLHAISYTKGCYTGQETVARVHFRGHVNRHLRGLKIAGAHPPRGATLTDPESAKPMGDVRSSARSPALGFIALGMVRREVAPGAELGIEWEGGSARAMVVALPFPR